jgi:hypothetical protein
MADSNDLREQLKLEKELLTLRKQRRKEGEDLTAQEMQSLNNIRQEIKEIQKLIKAKQINVKADKASHKEFQSFANEFKRLGPQVKEQLKITSAQEGVFGNLATQAAKQADIESRTSGIVSSNAKERKEILQKAKDTLVTSATNASEELDGLKGISKFERQRLDLEKQRGVLGNDTVDALILANLETEQLNIKTDTLKDLNQALPGPIQSMANGARSFGTALKAGMGPLFIIAAIAVAALKSFTDLDASAKSFRDSTGMTNTQMEGMKSQANELAGSFGYAGVNAEKVFDTMAALKSEFSDINKFSTEVVGSLTLLNTNFGVSAENAGKVQGIFEQIGGLSSNTAASVQMQVAEMANLAGVAPAKVFADIAESAEIASTLFQGDVEALTKAAIQARRLGTNLKSVAATSEHLLDFQSNIGDELVAATFVGGQFSLTQARSLAAAGQHVEAQKEVLRQLQRSGDFRKKDYFTQQQMAKAAGMSVEDINKQLNAQEKLNSLTSDQKALADEAIKQGLDISDIDKNQLAAQVKQFSKQQEMQASVEKLSNAFAGIAAAVGTALVPALEGMMDVINPIAQVVGSIFGLFSGIPGFFPAIIAGLSAMYLMSKRTAITNFIAAVPKIFSGFSFLGPLGIPLAVGAVAGLASMMSKPPSIADDMSGVPSGYGNTMVSTAGKGTIALNNNDSFVAGTNLGQGGGGNDTAAIVAAIRESKDVYMDGRRVTSRVASSVEKSSKNQYGFG